MEAKLVGDFRCVHGVGQILLVGEDKQERFTQFVLVQHAVKLLTCLRYTLAIVGVNDEDDALRVLEVYICRAVRLRRLGRVGIGREEETHTVTPERTDLILATHIPDGE
jgi:hypothetical protein